ncbi:hypothetical protein LA6_000970 [Marinibacterium anthonyi]|nr:hypothetical protein LA6_000970 [Marinibacterium anthonyi]
MAPPPLLTDMGQLRAAVDVLCAQRDITVLGVCGMAGAGKTTLCRMLLAERPGRAAHLECDLFSTRSHADRQARIARARATGDAQAIHAEENPQAWYDWAAIGRAIRGLRQDRACRWHHAWNRQTGELDAPLSVTLPRTGPALLLCDCIYLLHDPVRGWMDGLLLVQAPDAVIANRRAGRAGAPEALRRARDRQERFERPYFDRYTARADLRLSLR